MGFSLTVTTAVIGVTSLLILEILIGNTLPMTLDIKDSYYKMRDRSIDQIQTDIEITGLTITTEPIYEWNNSVDSNLTDVDSSPDKGIETNFPNAQDISPDSDYMNIQEKGGRGGLDWWNSDWDYSKKITIDSSLIVGDLYNFPVLIQNTSSDFSANARADGYDFRFVNESNATEYYFEIEDYNSTTGTLIVWVNITFLSGSVDTILWVYYGNASASTNPSSTSTWDSHFVMVQHLNETSGTHYDSTLNNHDTTTEDVVTQGSATGIVSGCDDFNGTSDKLIIADHDDFTMNTFTMEAWGRSDDGTFYKEMLLGKDVVDNREWNFGIDTTPDLFVFQLDTAGGYKGREDADGSETPSDTDWHYYVATCSGAGVNANYEIYIDTSAVSDADYTYGTWDGLANTATDVRIGAREYAALQYWWDGWIDEVRISDIDRSVNWLTTTYNTINSSSTFITVGEEETNNHKIDFEYNWSSADYDADNEEVCFYVGSHTGSENLNVNYWTGSAWSSLGTITSTEWTNLTATGLTSSDYIIQLIGATESGDNSQDDWDIDCIFLHTWNDAIPTNITVKNIGSTILKTDDFDILLNGAIKSFSCTTPYIYLNGQANFSVISSIASEDIIKVITGKGISDYYEYTIV